MTGPQNSETISLLLNPSENVGNRTELLMIIYMDRRIRTKECRHQAEKVKAQWHSEKSGRQPREYELLEIPPLDRDILLTAFSNSLPRSQQASHGLQLAYLPAKLQTYTSHTGRKSQ